MPSAKNFRRESRGTLLLVDILRELSAAAYHHFHLMIISVVEEWNGTFGLLDAVDRYALDGRTAAAILYCDVIMGLAKAIMDRETRPIRRKAGREAELVDFQDQAEQRFGDQTVHPAGGAGVPRPTAAARMGRYGVNVGGDDVGLHAVGGRFGSRVGVKHGVNQ